MAGEQDRLIYVFSEALGKPSTGERKRYLEEACAGDTALRQEVDLLLEAYAKAGDFLNLPLFLPPAVQPENDEPTRRGPDPPHQARANG